MHIHPEHYLLVYHTRSEELQAAARHRRQAKDLAKLRVRAHQLRSTTASALRSAAHVIAPSAA